MNKAIGLSLLLASAPIVQAADIEAGKQVAAAVCAACHGIDGMSVSDAIPNLAAQRATYIEAQLKAFKAGTRGHAGASRTNIMNVIQLSNQDIADVAAYFAAQRGAVPGTKVKTE
jgi:cytochrome c553